MATNNVPTFGAAEADVLGWLRDSHSLGPAVLRHFEGVTGADLQWLSINDLCNGERE